MGHQPPLAGEDTALRAFSSSCGYPAEDLGSDPECQPLAHDWSGRCHPALAADRAGITARGTSYPIIDCSSNVTFAADDLMTQFCKGKVTSGLSVLDPWCLKGALHTVCAQCIVATRRSKPTSCQG